ncbi:DUF6266 family protein [Pedobacter gandavensis]|uniref:DUF6266 family protein n=1 Tax=Pedobacter gandavensis TaxID=2679963 RepID=UPI00292E51D3|nr:DUF6266 family protein [Pedobacter gandavensis]
MAKCPIGPYGHPSGRIGDLVFYMMKGQAICRTIGKPGKASLKQMANRQSMSVAMALLKPMADFIKVSFRLEAEGTVKNAHNLATSYNKKHALTGEYPNIKVDYAKVILSNGSLEMAEKFRMSKGEGGLNLSWNTDLSEYADADDILMVLVSHPTKKRASTYLNAAKRSDGRCFVALDKEWMMKEQMEVYVCLKSANEQSISDSKYLGNLNGVPESMLEKTEKAHYDTVKARFDQVAASYEKQRLDFAAGAVETKAFRHLSREYQILQEKLLHLPGKPS